MSESVLMKLNEHEIRHLIRKIISESLANESKKSLSEATMQDVVNGCSPGVKSRSKNLAVSLKKVDPKNSMWTFSVQGSRSPYKVKLQVKRQKGITSVNKLDVLASCTCKFWRWQGPEHWATQDDYLYGKAVGTASFPIIRDPSGVHHACKHIVSCFDWVIRHDWKLPK